MITENNKKEKMKCHSMAKELESLLNKQNSEVEIYVGYGFGFRSREEVEDNILKARWIINIYCDDQSLLNSFPNEYNGYDIGKSSIPVAG